MSMVKMHLSNGQTDIPVVLQVMKYLHLAHVELEDNEGEVTVVFNNLTLNNLILKVMGPMEESHHAMLVLFIQALCSVLALVFLYDVNPFVNSVCKAPWLRKDLTS